MQNSNQTISRIVIAGGLTSGPVVPLLAVVQQWQQNRPGITPIIFDVKGAVSQNFASILGIKWRRIITGKLRRYWSWQNFLALSLLIIGFVQTLIFLKKIKPILVMGAGGFVQVPVIYAAWLLRIPRSIHQQDVQVTLSNRLCGYVANVITTTFESSTKSFPQGTGFNKQFVTSNKVFWTGNPLMKLVTQSTSAKDQYLFKEEFHKELPILLVTGGGSGAEGLNNIIYQALPELTRIVQIVHITGKGKKKVGGSKNYHPCEFVSNIEELYILADVVLSRAGINTITALAEYKKSSIIVPMPATHQEANAELLFKAKAALVLDQNELDTALLIRTIRKILFDTVLDAQIKSNIHKMFPQHPAKKIIKQLESIILPNGPFIKK